MMSSEDKALRKIAKQDYVAVLGGTFDQIRKIGGKTTVN